MKPQALMNWSGGKDSALALYRTLQSGSVDVRYLLTTLNDSFGRISMHGVREVLLDAQAERLGIPLLKLRLPETVSMTDYQEALNSLLRPLVKQGAQRSVFGDIFLEDLRRYREEKLAEVGLSGEFPLWNVPSLTLLEEFWSAGFQTVVVSVNGARLDASFCGRVLDRSFVAALPPDVDPCGENGEFHTFVFDAPYFATPIQFKVGETVERSYQFRTAEGDEVKSVYYFTDLLPED